jgi:FlaA1/EpsC-like NDP-sugar epimerase
MGNGGEVFVLDMGKPVKVLHLAEKLIALSGKRPYRDVDIVFTGVRPGEKMYEELFNRCETKIKTSHEQIMVAVSETQNHDFMERHLEEIRQMVRRRDEASLRHKFKELVPGYCSLTDVTGVVERLRPSKRTSHEPETEGYESTPSDAGRKHLQPPVSVCQHVT